MVTKQPLDIFAIGGQRGGGGGGIGWGRDDGHRPCSPSFPSLFFLIKDLRVAFFRETECRMCRAGTDAALYSLPNQRPTGCKALFYS